MSFSECMIFSNSFTNFNLEYRGPILHVKKPALGSDDFNLDQSEKSIQILPVPKFTTLILILGNPQYFFDGNQTDQHGCKCKQDNSCKTAFGNEFGCNCNARLPEWNIDKGTITGQSLSKFLLLSTITVFP